MFKNKLKKDLYSGKTCFGTFICMNSPDIVEICGLIGLDFVIIDTEHGYVSPESILPMIRAAEVSGTVPIVRVTENGETIILRCLDVGAYGVQVPQINDAESARLAVKRAKYYPEGIRGVAAERSASYGNVPLFDYFKQENEETLVSVHIENIVGLEHIEEIAATPGVDVIFLGPFDFSQSLGIPGQVTDPRVQAAADTIVAVCKKYGKIPGCYATDPENAKKRAEDGFLYIPIAMDTSIISLAYKNALAAAKGI